MSPNFDFNGLSVIKMSFNMEFPMKKILSLFVLLSSICFADQDENLWKSAYRGEYSIAHKLILSREAETKSDELINQFAMAYLFYKTSNIDSMIQVMKGIDNYIKRNYFAND